MPTDQFTFYHTIPELDQRLRAANEERAALVYAAWKAIRRAVSAAGHRLAEQLGRSRRAHQTYYALSALSDHQLRDIGLHRVEIGAVSEVLATERTETGLTVADLRRSGLVPIAGHAAPVRRLPTADRRQRRVSRAAERPAADAQGRAAA